MNGFELNLSGKIWWLVDSVDGAPEAEITEAKYRKTELVIDFTYEDAPYTVILKTMNGIHFMGNFSIRRGTKLIPVIAECILYENNEGYFLYGDTWREENYDMKWFAKLDRND